MSDAYYLTAEPVGVCSCHACTCPGCAECEERDDAEYAEFWAGAPEADPWTTDDNHDSEDER